jgi:hypothetical protein
MAPVEFGASPQKEFERRDDSVLDKQWQLLRHCCAENTQQIEMLKHMVKELATAVDEESSFRQTDVQNLRETVRAEVSAHSEISGLEETLQGLVQDRVGKLEELLRATIDKCDIEFDAERTAREACATEVQEMLESKWKLEYQLQELKLERSMAVHGAEVEQRHAKLAGEMQEFAAAMQKALELHKSSVEERFCIDKAASEVINEVQSIKASHDSQVLEVQSIKDFLVDEMDARQQQHRALDAAREQLQGHITCIVEEFGTLREDQAPASAEECAQECTSQHCIEVQHETVQPVACANAAEGGRAARRDDAAPAVEVHPLTASAPAWVQRQPRSLAWAALSIGAAAPPVGARPSRCSSPHDHCQTLTRVARPAYMPPDSCKAELQQQQQ